MNTSPITDIAVDGRSFAGTKSPSAVSSADAISPEDAELSKIRLLVFTSLYPNVAQPRHGIFVEERLRHLVDSGRIAATVIAPVPWFPFKNKIFGSYAAFAKVPEYEERHGIKIRHPRYLVIPKVGMSLAPSLMFRALLSVVRRVLREDSKYDLIDAHYLYPDGVAATAIGSRLGLPVVLTARGNDVTLIPRYRSPRRAILCACKRAAAVVTVSNALRDQLVNLGVSASDVSVLRNGVDLNRFKPVACDKRRKPMDFSGSVWLTVGHLIERKGVHIVIEALARVSSVTLLVVGDGPQERTLRGLVERLGLGTRVKFLGAKPHAELINYYNMADTTVLASSREGMPNVVLESLGCGTPVVAAPFAGVTEVLTAPEAGEIALERSADAIVSAWLRLKQRSPKRSATRAFAEQLGWDPVVKAQHALYARVLAKVVDPEIERK
ncbi:glycosyltransferase family 4 protein [Oleiagrimonas sp. C23AA]|uniref:glycosyltransferase family 4 protein n=1 Tax=Oleiagrimonas sp. C23AA TaxID=2719047 RepID=UPI001423B7FF|nr:glycosyltransferase family 4 protein [Oleiagrimonas sp. C23AA]NII11164.1 glycosyltransferase family 4 protein [Oleiagrimonas sp. C23AA]